jgi:hypothetical protein
VPKNSNGSESKTNKTYIKYSTAYKIVMLRVRMGSIGVMFRWRTNSAGKLEGSKIAPAATSLLTGNQK